jgi:hypothetical protein
MFKKIILGVMLFALCACPDDNVRKEDKPTDTKPVATNVPEPEKTVSPGEQNIETLKKKLEESEKKAAAAVEKGDTIAKLTAEKESLGLKVQLAEAYAKEWKQNAEAYGSQRDEKEKELKEAKLDAWKTKLWWMAGICGLLAIVAGGIAFGFPLLRPVAWKASAILGAIAGIMLFVAQALGTIAWLLGLVPYIIGIAVLAAIVYGAVALRIWSKDHNSLKQTIEGIEPIKNNIKGFGDHMLKYVDGNMVDHVKSYKKKMREVAAKAKAAKEALLLNNK